MDIAVADVNLDLLTVQVDGLDLEENKMGSRIYGDVYNVIVNGKKCVAKKLQNILIHAARYYPHCEDNSILRKFRNECRLMSQLKHPNVVGFVGVHYGRDRIDISLIMERLHCDLAYFVRNDPHTPLCDRLHILYDVSNGLDYLNSLSPSLMHRDLTASNILLTEDLTAKIGDFDVSTYVDPTGVKVFTPCPGHLCYMPPESRVQEPTYTTKLDIFSFGMLILHTIIGELPRVSDIPQSDPNLQRYIQKGNVELMRRDRAAHQQMGESHCLYPLVVCCLHDSPEHRPPSGMLRNSLETLCDKHPKPVRLDFAPNVNFYTVVLCRPQY